MVMSNNGRMTGNYRCLDDVSNFILRITLKEVLNETITENGEKIDVEELNVKWQEKKLGKCENYFYKDEKNCLTDLDKKYHEMINDNYSDGNKYLYSYVNEDEFCLQEENVDTSKFRSDLCLKMENLKFIDDEKINFKNNPFNKSYINPFINNNYVIMYIMADFGEYVEDIWIKQEYILVTIKYYPERKLLTMYPDFTIFEPYRLQINGDVSKIYEYTIENASHIVKKDNNEDKEKILDKITSHERKFKRLSIGNNFFIPPNDKLHFYVFLEILDGRNFEYDNVYVQYFIDLPENWFCFDQNQLRGSTQTCLRRNVDGRFYFGSIFEVRLCVDVQNVIKNELLDTPYIYFQVTSKDTFDRYRTEGICYLKLPILIGTYKKTLQCVRIHPNNITSDLRRFFIGDYMSYDDVTWFSIPKHHQESVLNKQGVCTISTGEIDVNFNVIQQSGIFVEDGDVSRREKRERLILGKLGTSSLVKSVEEVLQAFKKARKNMLKAREKVC